MSDFTRLDPGSTQTPLGRVSLVWVRVRRWTFDQHELQLAHGRKGLGMCKELSAVGSDRAFDHQVPQHLQEQGSEQAIR